MRFLFFIGFLLFIDLYSFQALRTIATQQWPVLARTAFFGLFWAVPVITILMFLASSNGITAKWHGNAYTFLRTFIFIAYVSKGLIVPFLAIDDMRRLVQWGIAQFQPSADFSPSRSRFLAQMGLALGSIPFFSLTYGMIRNPYRYRLFQENIALPNLPESLDGLRIVQISDIHSGSFTFKDPVKNAIDLINAQEPDLVFFTGDLVNSKSEEMEPFVDVFDKIKAKYGVFSIVGNHDYGDYHRWPSAEDKVANFDHLKDIHRRLGWQLLLNENRVIPIKGEQVAIIGVENYSAHPRFPKHGDLKRAYEGAETASLKLLLSHDPSHWENQVTSLFKDIAITFSGHTHGMQFGVEIPGIIKWSPIKYVYKQWAGLYQTGKQFLYVNRGLGFLGYPGRVGILPEVTLIQLNRQPV